MSEVTAKKRMVKWTIGIAVIVVLLFAGMLGAHAYRRSKAKDSSLQDKTEMEDADKDGYIGTEKAKEIAFAHAGVASENDVVKLEVEADYEHNSMIYEVSFFYENNKYNYDIHGVTGEIMEVKSSPAENKETAESTKKDAKKSNNTGDSIGEEKAKEIVLLHAKLDASEITDYKCETYIQKDTPVYKIKFNANGYVYSCDVHAQTGEIVKYNREPEHKGN